MSNNSECDYVVIGGGFAGLYCAYKLAEAGFSVTVLERRDQLMAEASHNNFARIHHGWHYPGSLATALECLPAAFEFLEEFDDVMIRGHHTRFQYGWCAFSPDSFTPHAEWLESAHTMSNTYKNIMGRYANSFGPAEEFFQVVNRELWEQWCNPSQISMVASTLESFVDLAALKKKVLQAVTSHPRISIALRHTVVGVKVLRERDGEAVFDLEIQTDTQTENIRAWHVLNASWASRMALDALVSRQMGDVSTPEITYRLKTFLKVALPERLSFCPSLLVVHGPFMTFTNCGDGTGIVDYAPVSNYDESHNTFPEEWGPMIQGNFSAAVHEHLSERILHGADLFIPGMKECTILQVCASALYHEGNANIYDPTTSAHHRLGTGLNALLPNWISLDTGKLSWVPRYANQMVEYALNTAERVSVVL